MAKTLLFVHGTGVRGAAYDVTCALIERQLKEFSPDVKLARCLWGESEGARLAEDGKSIPTYDGARGAMPDDLVPALWSMLLQDPAFELGMLASLPAPPRELTPNEEDPAEQLLERFRALRFSDALQARLAALGLTAGYGDDGAARSLVDLIDDVTASAGFVDCERSGFAGTAEHRAALARAVVAALQKSSLENGAPALDAETRDELAAEIRSMLGEDARGVGAWLMSPLAGIGLSLATGYVRRKRGALSDSAYPAAGDILLYQTRGGPRIRDFIRARIEALAGQDVILLAHSLGGIACVELLAGERPANVTHLITFGSQAPFLYEIGALATIEPGKGLPSNFPPWSNFYDLSDPLSYVGEDIFPGQVTDYPVESGVSFPASHSAYLNSRPFWQQLRALLRDA
jgi:hypothetical protein